MRHPLFALAAVTTLVTGSLVVALPAAARPLAPTRAVAAEDTLLGLSCDWSRSDDRLELSDLDPVTGVGTRIGTSPASELYFCAFSIAWDTVADSCTAFTLARGADEPPALLRTDLRTGLSAFVAPTTRDGAQVWASSMAIDDAGRAWALSGNVLHRLDLATGVLTPVVTISGASVLVLAFNPIDAQWYVTDGTTIYRLDPTTGIATPVLTPDLSRGGGAPRIEGMTFDRDGTLWLTAATSASLVLDFYQAEHELWSATLAGAPEYAGPITSSTEGVTIATLALGVVPSAACASLPTLAEPEPDPDLVPAATDPAVPTLAATGLEDATPALLPIGVLALALGAVLVNSARRARLAVEHRRGSRRGPR